ncbi:hypothetical protein ACH5RR_018717 [Cinchona calisaya]|uniref:Uncharacterized protein n=1 Tax=Cinchona calisaya TaxID=153742 RepID=A0ABD2ZNI5_9GENT
MSTFPNPSIVMIEALEGSLMIPMNSTKKIRAYAHCAKQSRGFTLLLINLDGNTSVQVKLAHNGTIADRRNKHRHPPRTKYIQLPRHKKTGSFTRDEYHLTGKDGDIHSQIMLLNGNELTVDKYENIPQRIPQSANASEPVTVAPYSIVSAYIPYIIFQACN